MGRCRISCACHAKPHTFKSGPNPVRFEHDMCFAPQPRALYISILKSARNLRCFYTFGFQMCIAPQWRALFNSSTSTSAPECSKHVVFFEHSDFEMCFAPQRRAFFISHLPDGSAPAALASPLFDPPEPQIIGKTQTFATLLPFRTPPSSFFSSLLFSSLTLPISAFSSVHIVGSLTSKLPSNI